MNEVRGDAAGHWLVLVFQFPKGHDSRRVRVWRRLQRIGAVAIKNSVYVLPLTDQAREDFAWLVEELQSSGAECALLEAQFVAGMTNMRVRELFEQARAADFDALTDEIDAAIAAIDNAAAGDRNDADAQARAALVRSRRRLSELAEIDFFGAAGRDRVETAMMELQKRVSGENEEGRDENAPANLRGRLWVTRSGVRVDRMASAWLIRRWIDADAEFGFVAGKRYETGSEREIRFDMFEAEYTHDGDLCTFEVLAREVRPDDAALAAIGEIVHDIDLKDGKFGRPETAGIASLLDGIVADTDDDIERIALGSAIFDNLYRFFGAAEN